MSKKGIIFIFGSFLPSLLCAAKISVFVSFSMPSQLLEETLKESVRLNIPVYLNGLHHDSMKETALKIIKLSKQIPNLNLQIDPIAFERFGIHQVPALVVEKDEYFDVLYGNLSLKEGLMRIANRGNSGLSEFEVRSIMGD
jgi:conjugal transfer pilus assembly protein TrbC